MKKYVYNNLKKFGNCFISEKELQKKGKTKILNDLRKQGFNCSIDVIDNKLYSFNNDILSEKDVIITLNKERRVTRE